MITQPEEEVVERSITGRTVLIVDDSMLIRHTLCRFLEERGVRVETATNGVEALQILSTVTPDVIVTDISMPQMTGSELITEIKKEPALESTPIVVLSAKLKAGATPEEMRADYFVFKDIDIEQQLDIVLTKAFAKFHT
jgi:CheY-like chemotaxis protein